MYTHDIIVIGGGAGGLSVASGAAQLGMKTAVIEREHMGGDCLHFGCVPSKTLIHTAGQFAAARGLSRFTASALDVPRANMPAINERISEVVRAIAFHDSPERFRSLGAEVYLGEARFKGPYEVDVDGTVLSAKRIVIATGSRAAVPPVPGLKDAGYLTNRDVFGLSDVPNSLAVLGAGPIGVELGQSFRRLGSEVTVIDMAPRIMPRDDEELADIVRRQMESEGITIITGAKVAAVETAPGGKTLTIDTGEAGGTTSVTASEILVAAGRQANTDRLNLEAAGVEVGRGGVIPVNDKLQSNVRHISVIGDANGNYPFTHVAGAEAALIIRRLALHAGGRMNYRLTPWVSYTDPELATVGHTQESAQHSGIRHRVVRQSFAGVDRAHAEEATDGLMKIVLDGKDKVIGVQIAAKGAGELIAPALHAVSGRWKFAKFRGAMTPYPTMSEVYGRAVSAELAPKLFNRRIRGILRVLFRYRGSGPSDAGQKEGQQ
ncbi:MAG: dihydrolipoyl dehydrogenase family protein [Spirochaetia bacterium]